MRGNIIKHRPAVFSALCLICGIAIAGNYPVRIPFWLAVSVPVSLLVGLFVKSSLRFLLAGFAAVLLGILLFNSYTSVYRNTQLERFAEFRPQNAVAIGTIVAISPSTIGETWLLDVDSVGIARQTVIPMSGRMLLRIAGPDTVNGHTFRANTYVRVYCSLEPFRDASNPHEFAFDRKIQTASLADVQGVIHSKYDCYFVRKLTADPTAWLVEWMAQARAWVVGTLDQAIEDQGARGFIKAVVLGERSDMSTETIGEFTAAGVSHILAVSGFNVAIIALVVAQLLRLIGIYWLRPRVIIAMLMVLFYCALVGFQPSVVRALFMIEIVFLAQLCERKPDPLNILCGAVAINVLLRPTDLFDVGFQLSYAAVLGLILLTPEFQRLLAPKPEQTTFIQNQLLRIRDAFLLSTGATLASYPIIAYHFHRVSFAGLLANIPIIPLSSAITALGFLLIPLTAIYTPLGNLYGEASTYITKLLLTTTKLAASLPEASHSASAPNVWFIVLYLVALMYIGMSATRSNFFVRVSIVTLATALILFIELPLFSKVLTPDRLQVLFFDVGQGDGILIHTPAGKSYFVDFGAISKTNVSRADRVIVPFLRAENITSVQAGIISHMHRDHYGGAASLLQSVNVGSMYTSGERVSDALARALDSICIAHHVSRTLLSRGQKLELDSDVTLYILHPNHASVDRLHANSGQNINSGSLAFKLVYRNTSVLFLGDVEESEEEEMRDCYGDFLKASVVKVAHHGSLTSSSKGFVQSVHPDYAVISVGEHNRFGHPAPAIVKRWMANGAMVYRTDLDGAIMFESDGQEIHRSEWR